MYMKECHKCGKASYSSSAYRTWLCPYCGTDLTKGKIMDENASEVAKAKFRDSLSLIIGNENKEENT